jgi:hypothetical protein
MIRKALAVFALVLCAGRLAAGLEDAFEVPFRVGGAAVTALAVADRVGFRAIGDASGAVELYDRAGARLGAIKSATKASVVGLRFSEGESSLAVLDAAGWVDLWSVPNLKRIARTAVPLKDATGIWASPTDTGPWLVAMPGGTLTSLGNPSLAPGQTIKGADDSAVTALRFFDHMHWAEGQASGMVSWQSRDFGLIRSVSGIAEPLDIAAIPGPKGGAEYAAVLGARGSVLFLRTKDFSEPAAPKDGAPTGAYGFIVDSAHRAVWVTREGEVVEWALPKGTPAGDGDLGGVTAVWVDPEGLWIYVGKADGTARRFKDPVSFKKFSAYYTAAENQMRAGNFDLGLTEYGLARGIYGGPEMETKMEAAREGRKKRNAELKARMKPSGLGSAE